MWPYLLAGALFFILQAGSFFSAWSNDSLTWYLWGLTSCAIISFAVFTVVTMIINAILIVVEHVVAHAHDKISALGETKKSLIKPFPIEEIPQKKGLIIQRIVEIFCAKATFFQGPLSLVLRFSFWSLCDDLIEFCERHKYEMVEDRPLFHFVVEVKSKQLASSFCGLLYLICYISAFLLIAASLYSSYLVFL